MAVWRASNKKNAPNGYYNLQRTVTPNQTTPKGIIEALFDLISRPMPDHLYFLKPMSPQDTGRRL
jgi:hypothetical protein